MGSKLLEGKVCLITGVNKGIGKAIAEKYCEEGAIVYGTVRDTSIVEEWAKNLTNEKDGIIKLIGLDLRNYNDIKSAILQIKKEQGGIDVLVNNAGVVSYEFISMINFEKLDEMFEVNVYATIKLIQLISKLMMRKKSGSIINISSIVGVRGSKGQLAYSATKGALNSITYSASKELAEYNIRVNAIAPGMVATERFKSVLQEKFGDKVKDIGFKRLAEPQEVADACVFFGSDNAKYVTGQILEIEGSTKI